MGTRLRVTAVVVVGLLSAAGLVLVLGGFPQRAEGVASTSLDAQFPVFPGTQMYPMGESLSLDGVPVQMGYFTATSSPTDIATFFADAWSKAGLSLTVSTSEDRAEVGAYDETNQSMRSVSMVRQGNRVVTIASIMPLQQPPLATPDDLPVAPGAMLVRRARSQESGRSGRSLAYVLAGDLAPAQKAVVAALTADGWSLVRTMAQPKLDGASLRLTKGSASALATLVAERETQTVGVQIQVIGAEPVAP